MTEETRQIITEEVDGICNLDVTSITEDDIELWLDTWAQKTTGADAVKYLGGLV